MNTFKNACMAVILAGSSLITPGVIKAQTITREQACEVLKRCAQEGCKFLPEHEPGFTIAFEKLSFTSQERDALDERMCLFDLYSYFCTDKLMGNIMQDPQLTLEQKKALVLCFTLKIPVGPDLSQQHKKYLGILKEYYIRTIDQSNKDKVIAYSKEELGRSKEELEKSKEELGRSKEELEKSKRTQELYRQIQGLEKMVNDR